MAPKKLPAMKTTRRRAIKKKPAAFKKVLDDKLADDKAVGKLADDKVAAAKTLGDGDDAQVAPHSNPEKKKSGGKTWASVKQWNCEQWDRGWKGVLVALEWDNSAKKVEERWRWTEPTEDTAAPPAGPADKPGPAGK